jgi:outer membrane immunogenic protein
MAMTGKVRGQFCFAALLGAVWTFGAASAADLPARMAVKAPPPPPPMFNWTGFYLGVNIGGSWGHQDDSLVGLLTNGNNVNGVIGGGQIGYNWQGYGSPWVFGVEADFQGSGQRASGSFVIPAGIGALPIPGSNIAYEERLDWFGTLRGRIGWAMGDQGRFLPYITGGLAYGQNNFNGAGTAAGVPVAFNASHTDVGWTVGAGIEWAMWDRWSAKLEYLYIDFGNGPSVALAPGFALTTNHLTDNIGRVGLNYRF